MYIKSKDNFRVEKNIFRKFIKFSLKEGGFLHALPTLVDRKGLHFLQTLVPMPVVHLAEKVNDEPVKVLNLLFFMYFFLNEQKPSKT